MPSVYTTLTCHDPGIQEERARIVEVSPMTLDHFIRTRKLQPSQRQLG
jgi:hypothetical protein